MSKKTAYILGIVGTIFLLTTSNIVSAKKTDICNGEASRSTSACDQNGLSWVHYTVDADKAPKENGEIKFVFPTNSVTGNQWTQGKATVVGCNGGFWMLGYDTNQRDETLTDNVDGVHSKGDTNSWHYSVQSAGIEDFSYDIRYMAGTYWRYTSKGSYGQTGSRPSWFQNYMADLKNPDIRAGQRSAALPINTHSKSAVGFELGNKTANGIETFARADRTGTIDEVRANFESVQGSLRRYDKDGNLQDGTPNFDDVSWFCYTNTAEEAEPEKAPEIHATKTADDTFYGIKVKYEGKNSNKQDVTKDAYIKTDGSIGGTLNNTSSDNEDYCKGKSPMSCINTNGIVVGYSQGVEISATYDKTYSGQTTTASPNWTYSSSGASAPTFEKTYLKAEFIGRTGQLSSETGTVIADATEDEVFFDGKTESNSTGKTETLYMARGGTFTLRLTIVTETYKSYRKVEHWYDENKCYTEKDEDGNYTQGVKWINGEYDTDKLPSSCKAYANDYKRHYIYSYHWPTYDGDGDDAGDGITDHVTVKEESIKGYVRAHLANGGCTAYEAYYDRRNNNSGDSPVVESRTYIVSYNEGANFVQFGMSNRTTGVSAYTSNRSISKKTDGGELLVQPASLNQTQYVPKGYQVYGQTGSGTKDTYVYARPGDYVSLDEFVCEGGGWASAYQGASLYKNTVGDKTNAELFTGIDFEIYNGHTHKLDNNLYHGGSTRLGENFLVANDYDYQHEQNIIKDRIPSFYYMSTWPSNSYNHYTWFDGVTLPFNLSDEYDKVKTNVKKQKSYLQNSLRKHPYINNYRTKYNWYDYIALRDDSVNPAHVGSGYFKISGDPDYKIKNDMPFYQVGKKVGGYAQWDKSYYYYGTISSTDRLSVKGGFKVPYNYELRPFVTNKGVSNNASTDPVKDVAYNGSTVHMRVGVVTAPRMNQQMKAELIEKSIDTKDGTDAQKKAAETNSTYATITKKTQVTVKRTLRDNNGNPIGYVKEDGTISSNEEDGKTERNGVRFNGNSDILGAIYSGTLPDDNAILKNADNKQDQNFAAAQGRTNKKLESLSGDDYVLIIPENAPTGSRFCVSFSVYPFDSHDMDAGGNDDSAYIDGATEGKSAKRSAESCVTVAKRPTISVEGGNAYSAAGFKTSLYDKNREGVTYKIGSWSEYGVFGKVNTTKTFVSGAAVGYSQNATNIGVNAYRNVNENKDSTATKENSDICTFMTQTIGNAECRQSSSTTTIGGTSVSLYTSRIKDIYDKPSETDYINEYNTTNPTKDCKKPTNGSEYNHPCLISKGVNPVTRDYYFVNLSSTATKTKKTNSIYTRYASKGSVVAQDINLKDTLGTANTLVLRIPEGSDFVIGGNIKSVSNYNEQMHDASDARMAVIIAKNVLITGNVTDIDAIIIAETVDTCYANTFEDFLNRHTTRLDNVTPASPQRDTPLTSSNCNKQLHFRGPVIAKNFILNRTYGADNANMTETGGTSRRAEIFELSPYFHLWSATQVTRFSQAATTYMRELPVRY